MNNEQILETNNLPKSNLGKTNLGKGLSALLGEEINILADNIDNNNATQLGYRKLPIAMLSPRGDQPRKFFDEDALEELAISLKNTGMLQPILARPIANNFEIIAGERRWRAAQRAGLHEVPVIIRQMDEQEVLEIALIENIQRENLNAIEEAEAFNKLQEQFNYTQEMLAERLGKSRSAIANSLRLLNLPEQVKDFVKTGKLSAGHVRTLIGLDDDVAIDIANQIQEKKLSVRAVEKIVTTLKQPIHISVASNDKNPNILNQETQLQEKLGLKAEINEKNNQGKIILHFSDPVQYQNIIAKLMA